MTVKDVIARLECLSGDSEVCMAIRKSAAHTTPNPVREVTVALVRHNPADVHSIVLLTDEEN